MTRRHWYLWLSAVAVSFLILELLGYLTGTFTLSQTVWAAVDQYGTAFVVVSSIAVGVVLGHFFWPRHV